MFESLSSPRKKLIGDVHQVIEDAEELLRMTASQAGDGVVAARDRIQQRLHSARTGLSELQEAALDQVKAASAATDEFVHQNPWASIGIGATLGLVVGLVIARRH